MKLNLGKLLHIAVKVAPHVIPILGLAQTALAAGKVASKEHDDLGDDVVAGIEVAAGFGTNSGGASS